MLLRLTLSLALQAIPAASFLTGNDLWQKCNGNSDQKMVCLGYIEGISDAMDGAPLGGRRACIPLHTTGGQLRDIVIAYLRAYANLRDYSATALVSTALAEAFTCQ